MSRWLFLTFLLGFVVYAPSTKTADAEKLTGKDLNSICNIGDADTCKVFLVGVLFGMSEQAIMSHMPLAYCPPPNVTVSDYFETISSAIKKTDRFNDLEASDVIAEILLQNYPCV